MTKIKSITVLLSIIVLCLLTTGCLTKKYIQHNQYLLNIKAPAATKLHTKKSTLFVYPIVIRAPFDQLNFLYRINNNQYLTDYYNGFLTSPTQLLYPILMKYLKSEGINVVTSMYAGNVDKKLQVEITELYADYRDRAHPTSRTSVNFLVTKQTTGKETILLDKSFALSLPLREKSTANLLRAWEQSFRILFSQGVNRVASLSSQSPHQPAKSYKK